MAQIGIFTHNEDGSFGGVIKTLNLNIKARMVVAEKESDKPPDLRALAGTIEIGAGWKKIARIPAGNTTRSSSTTRASPLGSTPASSRTRTDTPSSGRAEATNRRTRRSDLEHRSPTKEQRQHKLCDRPSSRNGLCDTLVPPSRLGLMKINGEGVPRRGDGELPQYPPDLAVMISSMQSNMGQHFLPGHIALVAIGETKRDRLGQRLGRDAAKAVERPLVGRR